MENRSPDKIILIGAGNLAWHISTALRDAGYNILQVFSRTAGSAESLGKHLGANWTTEPTMLNKDAEILLFCVSDRAISELLCKIDLKRVMMLHTAGSVPADVFRGIAKEYGVLYPLMTFTKKRELDFRKVPVCVEGSTPGSTSIIERMGRGISDHVCRMDSAERKILHLSGIIAANFSNHMYHLAGDLLRKKGMDPGLLKPLIMETAAKVMEMEPAEAQTGPASRKDHEVIGQHIDLLKEDPDLQKLYTFMSDSISNYYKHK